MIDCEQNQRILIIDDNESIHHDFSKILTHTETSPELFSLENELFGTLAAPQDELNALTQTFELSFASQGQQGWELACQAVSQQQPFAMAYVDMRMPPGWDRVSKNAVVGPNALTGFWIQDVKAVSLMPGGPAFSRR